MISPVAAIVTRKVVLSMGAIAGFALAGVVALASMVVAAAGSLALPEQPLSKMAVSSKPQRIPPWLRRLITDLHSYGSEFQAN